MNSGSTFSISGQGVWSVDNTGILTFTLESEYTASPIDVTYTVQDDNGLTSNAATINIKYNPYAFAGNDDLVCVGAGQYQLINS